MKTVNYRVLVTQGILVSPGFSYSRYLRYLNPHLGQDSVVRGEGAVHQAPGPGPLQSPEPVDPALGPRIILDPLVTGVDLGLQLRPVTLPMGRRDADPALGPGISLDPLDTGVDLCRQTGPLTPLLSRRGMAIALPRTPQRRRHQRKGKGLERLNPRLSVIKEDITYRTRF